jgi:anthranilate synthase/aminodeoxychorismate synthase-like glutamine amidotransferase
MKIALIDNYDSFTYNLYDYICRLGAECRVFRNDKIEMEQLSDFDAILLSPGPGRPSEAGQLMKIIASYYKLKPFLGICLGHQALGAFFGAELSNADLPVHGKTSLIEHYGTDIFKGIENPMQVMRYHSLLLYKLPDCLKPLAQTQSGELMAFRHHTLPIYAVQFHPESILTPSGLQMMDNWMTLLKF